MIAFCDIETTSLDPWRGDVIVASFIISNNEFEIVAKETYRFRPFKQWDEGAAKVHGFTKEECAEFPNARISFEQMIVFLAQFDRPDFVCHALPIRGLFDYNFLFALAWELDLRAQFYSLFQDVKSTIIRSKNTAKDLWGIENQKLDTWAKKLGIPLDHHSAPSDVNACYEIYKYQNKLFKG